MNIPTVGALKRLLEKLPDDLVIGGYSGRDVEDYLAVNVYVNDRSDCADWENWRNDKDIINWWGGEVPAKVLVFAVD